MPDHIYFPTHIGLLQKEHRDRIGPAVWEFLWCISKTTKEEVEDGETLGIVLGGKPISYNEVAKELGGSKSTVKRNFERLEEHEYIYLKRTPYGHLIRVRNSKKFIQKKNKSANNSTGAKNDTGAINEQGGAKNDYPRAKNGHSNKDKEVDKEVDINITTTTGHARESDNPEDAGAPQTVMKEVASSQGTSITLLKRYLELKGQFNPSPKDQEAAEEVEQEGVPADQAVQFLEEKFRLFNEQRKHKREKINGLNYCTGYILDRFYQQKEGAQGEKHSRRNGGFARKGGKSTADLIRQRESAKQAWSGT